MTFERGKCYSHRKMLDVKIYVKDSYVEPLNDKEYLRVIWTTWQGRILADDEFLVPENIEDWYPC